MYFSFFFSFDIWGKIILGDWYYILSFKKNIFSFFHSLRKNISSGHILNFFLLIWGKWYWAVTPCYFLIFFLGTDGKEDWATTPKEKSRFKPLDSIKDKINPLKKKQMCYNISMLAIFLQMNLYCIQITKHISNS
jgi:hypothetical protein